MKTFLLLLALTTTAVADPRTVTLSPVAMVGSSLETFCKQSPDAGSVAACRRNSKGGQCHDAEHWDPAGTSVVREARIVELHGDKARCVPAVRTLGGWGPFVDGGMPIGRDNDARVGRIDIVEPKDGASYVLFRLEATGPDGIAIAIDRQKLSFTVCRVDGKGLACGTHAMEAGLDAKMREDGRVELMPHVDSLVPGAKPMAVSRAAKAQIGVYDLTL